MRVVIASGGTGGHIYPGLAVAAALRERDPRTEILFIGSGGLEARLIPQQGWSFRRVTARQFPHKPSLRAVWSLAMLGVGGLQALALLWRVRPHVVLATGGYAAAPVGLAAAVLRIPLVIQEQNLFAGVTNRLLARGAAAISIPHERVRVQFPRRAMVTGVPIRRSAIATSDREGARTRFGLRPGVFTILVLGGSQGAKSLNEAMLAAAPLLRDPGSVQILHQTGKGHEEHARARAREIAAPQYVAVGYIEDVADAYASADLVVCRAGAGTIAEVSANGLPAVAVPYPFAAAGHQETNARLMEEEGAAVVVLDRDLSGARVAEVIDALRSDPARLRGMAEASRRLGRPRAAAQVAELVAQVARKEQR